MEPLRARASHELHALAGISLGMTEVLEGINFTFFIVFLVEMVTSLTRQAFACINSYSNLDSNKMTRMVTLSG